MVGSKLFTKPSNANCRPTGWKGYTYQIFFADNADVVIAGLLNHDEKLRGTLLYTIELVRLVFMADFPGTLAEHAATLRDVVISLNTTLHSVKGLELTTQFHRLLHLPDLLWYTHQFKSVNEAAGETGLRKEINRPVCACVFNNCYVYNVYIYLHMITT